MNWRSKRHRTTEPTFCAGLLKFVLQQCYREEEATEVHGHITSLAVARSHRKLGIATRLMEASRET